MDGRDPERSAPRNARGRRALPGFWAGAGGPRSERGACTKTQRTRGLCLSRFIIRKISEAKGTHGNIVIGKSIFLKNFYKWKLLQVQAIFKNTTTWVAGRRGTAVCKYFSEGVNIRPHSAVSPEGLRGCVGPAVFAPHPQLLRGLCDPARMIERELVEESSLLEIKLFFPRG